ncbi:MAG: class I SAM-dependent DNA methyltransferase [Candidatus Parabeggiatoa sp.]|nr:class I SAM-dependent DNA methyltransferase [Candidatus Parabeggiatoa sp.]
MLTETLRSQIDNIWEHLWTSPLDPLTFIEQIAFLMLARQLDLTGEALKPTLFTPKQQTIRWSHFKNLNGDDMLKVVRDERFPHFEMIGGNVGKYMANVQLKIDNPQVLKSVVNTIDQLPLMDNESAGELYEYLLSKLTTAGMKGQFRTPRHIVRLMVEMLDPQPPEIIGDPVCGTGGFLVCVLQYIQENNIVLEKGVESDEDEKSYQSVSRKPYPDPIQNNRLHGFDFDSTMLRLAAINLMLHGIKTPNLYYQDLLNNDFYDNFPELSNHYFDLILATPPLESRFNNEAVHASPIGKVRTKKPELLFIARILNLLKPGGRAATIVPNSVLFASSKAHTALRQLLVEENQLAAVISLPSGVFQPYTAVSSALLIFIKRHEYDDYMDNVFFYDVQADGFSLDNKRVPVKANDLPDVLQHWKAKNIKQDTDRTAKAFYVPIQEIRDNKYNLSNNRYKERVYEEMVFEPPLEILARMKKIEAEIQEDLKELEGML